jgi:hypothetical protein
MEHGASNSGSGGRAEDGLHIHKVFQDKKQEIKIRTNELADPACETGAENDCAMGGLHTIEKRDTRQKERAILTFIRIYLNRKRIESPDRQAYLRYRLMAPMTGRSHFMTWSTRWK